MADKFSIVVFPGDNCGPEVMEEALKVLKVLRNVDNPIEFDFNTLLLGGGSIDSAGVPLTESALEAARNSDAVLLGAIGGPKWGTGQVRPEQGLLKLRKGMEAFSNLRPCNFAAESLVNLSPLKVDVVRGTDFTIIRELCGGMYFGPGRKDPDDSRSSAQDVDYYTRPEIERVARVAGHMARQHDPPLPVWSLDKANVLASAGRLWRLVVSEVFENEFPDVALGHHLIDSAAMLMIKNPRALNGIVLTSNLFGDIISDEASVIPGSLGLMPSASLCDIPCPGQRIKGIYEPIHGSAPDIAGKDIVNPTGMILSAAMMLRYSFGRDDLACLIEKAVAITIDSGVRTRDLDGSAGTKDFGDAVVANLFSVLA